MRSLVYVYSPRDFEWPEEGPISWGWRPREIGPSSGHSSGHSIMWILVVNFEQMFSEQIVYFGPLAFTVYQRLQAAAQLILESSGKPVPVITTRKIILIKKTSGTHQLESNSLDRIQKFHPAELLHEDTWSWRRGCLWLAAGEILCVKSTDQALQEVRLDLLAVKIVNL